MGQPVVTSFADKHRAYAHVCGEMTQALTDGRDLEVQVQPYGAAWRVVTFDHTAAPVTS